MSAPFSFHVWGARGSLTAPALGNETYGSDTCCVEVRCGTRVIVLDAGTGIVPCGRALAARGVRDFDILLTHCHYDHVSGLPFLPALFDERARVRVHAGHFLDATTCRGMVADLMRAPFFPVTPAVFAASIDYLDFRPPAVLDLGDGIRARTTRLNHPNGAVGYRLDYGGRSLCYVTDTEHEPGRRDPRVLDLIAGADLMIYDCALTDAEFETRAGLGHSTWEEGVRLCRDAGVPELLIFHHDLARTDAWLNRLAIVAAEAFAGARVAGAGLEGTVGAPIALEERA